MLRRIIVIAVVAAISVFWMSGCKKTPSSDASKSQEEVVKTQAEYDAEAKENITKDNMASELEKMEKDVEQEVSEQP